MKHAVSTLIYLTLLMVSCFANADNADNADKASYIVCIACHGEKGAGAVSENSPAIAGLDKQYVKRQLENYKSGARGTAKQDISGGIMRAIATSLTDEKIHDVSSYVGSMPSPILTDSITGDIEAGRRLYGTCAACHGSDAKGLQALNAPSLVLQQDWYLVTQLNNFKNGLRAYESNDVFGRQMQPMALILVDDGAINDVVAFIGTLRQKDT